MVADRNEEEEEWTTDDRLYLNDLHLVSQTDEVAGNCRTLRHPI